jgi:8-oxo-dGTP diphosphatase
MKTVETESGKMVAFMPECDKDLFELGRMAERLQKHIVRIDDKEKGNKITAIVISKELLMREMRRPGVGVGVYIIRGSRILMGKRKNAHGDGDWCPPGGHLEFGESWENCAIRETLEETGLPIKNIRFGAATNDIFKKDDKHYITIALIADYVSGEAERKEPDKCEKWEWFRWDNMPEPLFVPVKNAADQGFNPFKEPSIAELALEFIDRTPNLNKDEQLTLGFFAAWVQKEHYKKKQPEKRVTMDSKGTIHVKLPGNAPSGGISL